MPTDNHVALLKRKKALHIAFIFCCYFMGLSAFIFLIFQNQWSSASTFDYCFILTFLFVISIAFAVIQFWTNSSKRYKQKEIALKIAAGESLSHFSDTEIILFYEKNRNTICEELLEKVHDELKQRDLISNEKHAADVSLYIAHGEVPWALYPIYANLSKKFIVVEFTSIQSEDYIVKINDILEVKAVRKKSTRLIGITQSYIEILYKKKAFNDILDIRPNVKRTWIDALESLGVEVQDMD